MSAHILVAISLSVGAISAHALFESRYKSEKNGLHYLGWNILFLGFQDTDILDQYAHQLNRMYGTVVAVSNVRYTHTLLHYDPHRYLIIVNICDEADFGSIQELDILLQNTLLGLSVVILLSPYRQRQALFQFVDKQTHFSLATNVLLCFSNDTLHVDSETHCFETYTIKSMKIWKMLPKRLQFFADYFTLANDFSRGRNNFNGEEILAAAVWTDNVIQFYNDSKNGIQFSSGTQVEEYFYLRDALNFTARAVISDGALTEVDGILNNSGLAKSLNSGKADIAILTHQFLTTRLSGPHHIQYLHPTHYTKSWLVFVQPVGHSLRNIYTTAFDDDLWKTLAFTSVALFVIFLFQVYISKAAQLPVDYGGISNIVMWIITVLTQECLHQPPNFLFFRIFCLTTFFGTTIIYSVYSSSLIATFSIRPPPIQSVNDLVKADFNIDYNIYSPALIPITTWLKGNKTVPPTRAFTFQEAIPVLLSSKSAFLTSEDSFYYLLLNGYSSKKLCKFISAFPISSQKIISATFVRHRSEYKDYFNRVLLQIGERGVKRRLMLKYETETTLNCAGPTHEKSSTIPIALNDAFSVFAFLTASLLFTLFLLLIEYYLSYLS